VQGVRVVRRGHTRWVVIRHYCPAAGAAISLQLKPRGGSLEGQAGEPAEEHER
jgi:hypothetical protein